MRRTAIVAFAVLASLLMVTAQPAAAADAELEVASKNTTDTDFRNATTLTNVSVEGSGTAASVVLQEGRLLDSFEDGDVAEYGGDTGKASVGTNNATDGSNNLVLDSGGSGSAIISTTDLTVQQGDRIKADLKTSADNGAAQFYFGTSDETTNPGAYLVDVNVGSDTVFLSKEDTSGSFTELASTSATLTGGEYYTVDIDWQTDGTISVTVTDSTGSTVATLSATDTTYTSGGIGWREDGSSVMYGDYARVIGGETGQYVSATHAAEGVQKGWTNLTLQNASATVEWRTDTDDDGTFETVVNSSTYTSGGNKTLALDTSYDDWRVNVTFDNKSGTTAAKLHDEGVLFNAATPDGSNAAPTGNISSYDGDISLDVNDSDFGLAQGDSVTVEATNASGGTIGSTTISSNQTVTFSYSAKAGENDITWTLTDSYGESTTVSQSFSTPSTLYIRNETAPSNLVTSKVTVRQFGSEEIIKNTTTNGKLNLSGAPAGRPLIITADANGYHRRTIVVDSIFQQQTVYLLNDSIGVEVRFKVNDQTGRYSESPIVQVKKPITRDFDGDGNKTTQYAIVLAGEAGVNGFSGFLESDIRYRIRIRNAQGDSRTLGPYRAPVSETVTLTVGELTFGADEADQYKSDASRLPSATSGSGEKIVWNYSDPQNSTDKLDVVIHERGNFSNKLLDQEYTGPFGNKSVSAGIPADENETRYVVNWTATFENGDTVTQKDIVGRQSDLVSQLDAFWKRVVSILLLFMVAGLFSRANVAYGAIVTAIVGGMLWQVGWMGGATSGAALVIAMGAGVYVLYGERQAGPY